PRASAATRSNGRDRAPRRRGPQNRPRQSRRAPGWKNGPGTKDDRLGHQRPPRHASPGAWLRFGKTWSDPPWSRCWDSFEASRVTRLKRQVKANLASSPAPIHDASLAQIIGRDFHGNRIAGNDTDKVLAHASGDVRDDLMAIGQLDAELRIRQGLLDLAFDL